MTKYWSAGFNEEAGFSDGEGEWVRNPDFEYPPRYDTSYAHQAIMVGSLDCLEVLLKQDLTLINARNDYDETPLHFSVMQQAKPMVQALLERRALLSARDAWGETPLHNAAYSGNHKIAELLLNRKADPNVLSEAGLTPLHIAFARLDLEMVKLFLKYDGDLSTKPFHMEEDDERTVADLLYNDWSDSEEQRDQFIIDLIEHLEFGWEDEEKRRTVENLMTLIDDRAQLSDNFPGFDYYDSETELEYVIDSGDIDNIDHLACYILDCPDRIAEVLESEAFINLKAELMSGWLEQANEGQYQNLKTYAEEHNDKETLDQITISDSDSED